MVGTLILCMFLCGCIEKVEKKPDLFDKTQAIAACDQMMEQFQATLNQELVRAVADTYSDDVAIGYRTGESRGAFSVVVTYPAARKSITELLSEQGK